MSANNLTEEAVFQTPNHTVMVRHIQRRGVVARICNQLSISVFNNPDDLRKTIEGEHFYIFDRGKEDPNHFISFTKRQNLEKK